MDVLEQVFGGTVRVWGETERKRREPVCFSRAHFPTGPVVLLEGDCSETVFILPQTKRLLAALHDHRDLLTNLFNVDGTLALDSAT